MSDQIKSRLQHNKTVVDEYLMKKTLSHVEVVGSECAVEFFEYLRDIGIADSFASAAYQAERKSTDYQEFFPLLYMLNILTGQKSVRRSQILLKDQALMHVMGWSDEKTERGICQRGTGNQYGQGFVRKAGLVASTTLVDNLARFAYSDLEACFNQYIKSLVSQNHINLGKVFILDSTIVETIKDFPGAQPVRRQDDESGEIWGFKVFVLLSAKTKIPVAIHITPANQADSPLLLTMIEKGIANVGKRIKQVVIDRGFLDGAQLHHLKHKLKIDFAIPVKKGMDIHNCLIGLREEYRHKVVEWEHGQGKSGGYFCAGSVSYSQYSANPSPFQKGQEHDGDPLNAVVITRFAGKEIAVGKEKVIITSLDTDNALDIVKLYGQRTLIENCTFRELKQAAALGHFPQYKGQQAEKMAYIHMLLCVFSLAVFNVLVTTVFNKVADQTAKLPACLREFRFVKECEKPKLLIIIYHYYHVYDAQEIFMMQGFNFVPRG